MEELDRCAVCDARLSLVRVFAGFSTCAAHEGVRDAETERLQFDIQANDR